jgi:hypothetical protein
MANTSIRIKRSGTTSSPVSLQSGELAYSYLSNTIFIGSPDGTGVINIGGYHYTSQIDSATDSSTVSTIVKRDASGNASFNGVTAYEFKGELVGNANSATQFKTDRYISISGGDITASAELFNGTANATISASLNDVSGLTAGTYGGSTTVPILQVAANGRIMAIANSTTISTTLGIAGDTGTDDVDLASGDLTFTGGEGITTTVSDNAVTFDVDTTVLRTNTSIGLQTIDGSVEINGDLTVIGTQTIINTQTLNVADPLMILAGANKSADVTDIGFVGTYYDGSTVRHSGLIRNAGDKDYYIFNNYDQDVDGTNEIDTSDASFRVANVHANLISQWSSVTDLHVGTITSTGVATLDSLTLTNELTVENGGTGATTFTGGSILVGNGTGALQELSNTTYSATGTSGLANSTVTSITVDAYGRTTAATYTPIAGLTVGQGGTGVSTFEAGKIVVGDGANGLKQLANVSYSQTGSLGAAKTITSVTVDDYGRLTAATVSDISGLSVTQGGTGASSFTNGAMLVGGGSGAISELANVSFSLTGTLGAAKTITSLTVDDYGRVTAATAADISGLTVAQGGTGASTFTAKGIVYGDGTNAMAVTAAAGTSDQTFSNQILTTTNAGVPVWTSTLDGGQF